MRKRGSVTIFICLVFICISALICGLLESARTSSVKLYLQTAGDSSIDSLFSRYHRQLWENYKILSLESESDEKLKDLMLDYIKPYVENGGMYMISNPQIQINKKINLYDNGGMYLEQEIIDYMKLGIFESFFEGSPDDLWKDIEDAKSMENITSDYGFSSKEAVEVEKALKRISENINEQEKIKSKMRDALNMRNLDEIKTQAEILKETLSKIPKLVKKYEKKADKMSEKLKEIEADHTDDMVKLSECNRAYIEGEIVKFKEYVDRDSERRQEVAALNEIGENIIKDIENLEADIDSLQEAIEEDDDDEEDYTVIEGWNNVSDDINSLSEMELNFQFGIADENKENMLKQVRDLVSDGIFSLVIPGEREVSDKTIVKMTMPSNAVTGVYTGRNLAERLLVDEYMGLYFADFTDNIDTPLSYELEYILNGENSDRANLGSTILQILAIREGLNYMHIITDSEKMEQADALAAAISGAVCLPQIQALVKFLIITVWTLVESAIDIKNLLAGGKVPLFKTKSDWKLDLDSIFEVLMDKKLGDKGGSDRGINYECYLKMLLYLRDPVKRNFRMMDIMQLDIGVEQKDFLIKDMIYGLDADIGCGDKRLFSEISFFSDEFSGLDSTYDLKVKVEKIY